MSIPLYDIIFRYIVSHSVTLYFLIVCYMVPYYNLQSSIF